MITYIEKGDPADQTGMFRVGDRIVSINSQVIDGLTHEQIIQLLLEDANAALQFRKERPVDEDYLMKKPKALGQGSLFIEQAVYECDNLLRSNY